MEAVLIFVGIIIVFVVGTVLSDIPTFRGIEIKHQDSDNEG